MSRQNRINNFAGHIVIILALIGLIICIWGCIMRTGVEVKVSNKTVDVPTVMAEERADAPVRTGSAVIHHTASPDWGVERIRKIHVEENGWDDIGYHFVIRKNGTVETGRPLTKKGAHAKGRNEYVGIALTGNDSFTQEQVDSLVGLLKKLGTTHIEPHHENCPGPGLDLEKVKRELIRNPPPT